MKAKLLLLLISIIVALFLGEVILRLIKYDLTFIIALNSFHTGDKELGWVGVPNFFGRFKRPEFDVVITSNENGFRRVKSNTGKKENAAKIAFLGDSFTWGWGVDNESTFAHKLQQMLGEDYDVENYGMSGYGNVQELILFKRILSKSSAPAHLFVMIFKNDFMENIGSIKQSHPFYNIDKGEIVLKNFPVKNPLGNWFTNFRRKSYVLTFLAYGIDSFQDWRRRRGMKGQVIDGSRHQEEVSEKSQAVMQHVLNEFKLICLKHGIALTIVYIPCINDFHTQTPYRKSITQIAKELNLSYIDLTDAFQDKVDTYYFKGDGHWNGQGHALAAKVMKRYLDGHLGMCQEQVN